MRLEKYTNEYQVLESGSFILYDNTANAKVKFDFRPEFPLIGEIEYEFIKDPSVQGSKLEADGTEGKLKITCKNLDNLLGNCMLKPGILGERDGK